MKGFATPLTQEALQNARDPDTGEVIAVVVDKNFPDEILDESLAAGVSRYGDAVWVVRSTDTRTRDRLAAYGVEAVEVPLVAHWRVTVQPRPEAFEPELDRQVTDVRRVWRNCEIANYTTRVIVYRDMSSETSKWWTEEGHRHDHVRVVEHGAKKKRRKKGRNPQA